VLFDDMSPVFDDGSLGWYIFLPHSGTANISVAHVANVMSQLSTISGTLSVNQNEYLIEPYFCLLADWTHLKTLAAQLSGVDKTDDLSSQLTLSMKPLPCVVSPKHVTR
jgi:hypothetical protein